MKLVSVPELSQILGLCASTIRTRIRTGEWPCYSFGERSIRFDLDEIKQLLRTPAKAAKVNNSRAKRSSVSEILADQRGEALGLRGSAEKEPRRKR